MAADTDTAMTAPVVSPAATAQLQAIRDEWLRPFVERIEELSRENGRLETERDALRTELAELQAAQNLSRTHEKAAQRDVAAADASEARHGPYEFKPAGETLALAWRRWWRRVRGAG
jgi:hypothetical protein